MGRELAHQRITNSITKSTSYTYNFDGSLATLTYPSGRIITYTTDSAGRLSVAKDVANSVNYVTGTCANGVASNGACYAPIGALARPERSRRASCRRLSPALLSRRDYLLREKQRNGGRRERRATGRLKSV
jgi:hypothetical protein